MRTKLGLTQEQFAGLLGFAFASVNKWENDASSPTDMSAALLTLLENAIEVHPPADVIRELRVAGGAPLEVIRVLAKLEVRP